MNITRYEANPFAALLVVSLMFLVGASPFFAAEAATGKEGKVRIALAGLFEEVNTFADETMGKAKITGNMTTGFQQWTDKAIIEEYRGSKTYMGGFIAALEESPDVEIVPTTFWSFSAGPTIEGKAYQKMKQDILDRLAAAMPLDAIALSLHGAGVAEGVDDVETDLTAAIRKKVEEFAKRDGIYEFSFAYSFLLPMFRTTRLLSIPGQPVPNWPRKPQKSSRHCFGNTGAGSWRNSSLPKMPCNRPWQRWLSKTLPVR